GSKEFMDQLAPCTPLMLFVITYTVLLTILLSKIALDPLDNRYLSPIFIPLELSLIVIVTTVGAKLGSQPWITVVRRVLALGAVLWLLYPVTAVGLLVGNALEYGAGGFHQKRWIKSELLEYLRQTSSM